DLRAGTQLAQPTGRGPGVRGRFLDGQLLAHDLARRGARDGLDDVDVPRLLVTGDPAFEVIPYRRHINVAAGLQDHERGQSLAEPLVGDADDRLIDDAWVLCQCVFDRARINVLTAGDDHVVFAADDVETAGVVEVAHVPRARHAVDHVFRPAARVTLAREVATDEDASGNARTDGSAGLAEDPHRAPDDRFADGFRSVAQVGRRRQRADAYLGGSVPVVEDVTVGVHEPLAQGGFEAVPAGYHAPQVRQRISRQHMFGQVEDAREHDGYGREGVRAVQRRLREGGLGVELAPGEYRAAERHREHQHAEPEPMKHGHRHRDSRSGSQPGAIEDRRP